MPLTACPKNNWLILSESESSRQEDVYEIDAKGSNTFEKHFYLIHFGDWLSYYLAIKQGYDPSEIDVLIKLKGHMGALK